jgi:hypothetical protein
VPTVWHSLVDAPRIGQIFSLDAAKPGHCSHATTAACTNSTSSSSSSDLLPHRGITFRLGFNDQARHARVAALQQGTQLSEITFRNHFFASQCDLLGAITMLPKVGNTPKTEFPLLQGSYPTAAIFRGLSTTRRRSPSLDSTSQPSSSLVSLPSLPKERTLGPLHVAGGSRLHLINNETAPLQFQILRLTTKLIACVFAIPPQGANSRAAARSRRQPTPFEIPTGPRNVWRPFCFAL